MKHDINTCSHCAGQVEPGCPELRKEKGIKTEESVKCQKCEGNGWTPEHDPTDPHNGGVCTNCPIQVQCADCRGTGQTEDCEEEIDDLS